MKNYKFMKIMVAVFSVNSINDCRYCENNHHSNSEKSALTTP